MHSRNGKFVYHAPSETRHFCDILALHNFHMIEPKNGAGEAGAGYYRPYALCVASPTDGKPPVSRHGGNMWVSEWCYAEGEYRPRKLVYAI